MKNIVSEKVYSPQSYLEKMTGEYFINTTTLNDVEFIEHILTKCFGKGYYVSFSFSNINEAIENDRSVVLVDCLVDNQKTGEFDHVYRWFEVDPDLFKEE